MYADDRSSSTTSHNMASSPAKSVAVIGILSALTLALGFGVQAVLAAFLGASRDMDVFFVSLALPAFIANVSLGALSFALVPVFKESLSHGSIETAWALARHLMARMTPFCIVLGFLLVLGADLIVRILAPGFDTPSANLAASLMRVMSVGAVIDIYRGLLSAYYYSQDRFFFPQVAPILNHSIMILSAFTLLNRIGLYGLAIGWSVGSVLMLLVLATGLSNRSGWLPQPKHEGRDHGPILRLVWPSLTLVLVVQIIPVIDRAVATSLSPGAVSYLGYGYKVMETMLRTAPMAVSLALFPRMSSYALMRDWPALQKEVTSAVRWILLASIPTALLVLLLKGPLVRVLFERGAFDQLASHGLAKTIGWYALALLPASVLVLINHVFFAVRRARVLAYLAIGLIGLTVVLDCLLSRVWGYEGIAAAYVVVASLGVLVSARILAGSAHPVSVHPESPWLARVLLAAAALGMTAYAIEAALSRVDLAAYKDVVLVASAVLAGSLSYLIFLWLARVPELRRISQMVTYKLQRMPARSRPL